MSWIRRVRLQSFVRDFSKETFKVKKEAVKRLPPMQFQNYVPEEFTSWVNDTVIQAHKDASPVERSESPMEK